MKKIILILFLGATLALSACAPPAVTPPTPAPATSAPAVIPSTTSAPQPTAAEPTALVKRYENSAFGLSFALPGGWFGPEEYISGEMLRVEVGSDVVYPYGTDPSERTSSVKNSYAVVLQFSKNDQNQYWRETLQLLDPLKDGESSATSRSLTTRVRALELGRFKGYEYIVTLPDTAQTEPVYLRQVTLADEQNNLITLMGQPINVDLSGGDWRSIYQKIDQANQANFEHILETLKVE
jgi:hypothetical protein